MLAPRLTWAHINRMRIHFYHSRDFASRLARFTVLALCILAICLAVGTFGYHEFARLNWIDAFLNASMILTGMGPVDPMPDDAAKLFASVFALIGGAVYPALAALVLYPIVHRMMAAFHLQSLTPPDPSDGPNNP